MGFKSLLDRILLNFIIAGKNKVLVEIGTDCMLQLILQLRSTDDNS